MRRISFRTGALFAAATIPGSFIGSWLTRFIPRREFGIAFGVLAVAAAAFLAVTRSRRRAADAPRDGRRSPGARVMDTVVTRDGQTHVLAYNPVLGVIVSLLIGCFSSLVGIGGGLIHVPLLNTLFGFPVHIATATSQFILIFTALAGVVEHALDGTWPSHLLRDACLALGVVGGAQLGAFLSRRIASAWIMVGLALALAAVGVRLVLSALQG
jgi:uncharacterized membrane protein YfcA